MREDDGRLREDDGRQDDAGEAGDAKAAFFPDV